MPKKPRGLQQLMVDELQDLYDAEKQLTRVLAKVAKSSNDEELQEAIREHLDVTKGQTQRLEQVFETLGMKAKSRPCAGMRGIIQEAQEMIEEKSEDFEQVLDIAIVGGARRIEHYEIAGYTAAIDMARQLGHDDIAGMLEETLEEEHDTDERLAEVGRRILEEAHTAEQSSAEEGGEVRQTRGAGGQKRAKARAAR